ncbi:hypothetical protein V3472_04450 [Lacticaseibacillus rhamnosus]
MVKRAVIQLITPGTNIDIKAGAAKTNNYITAVLPHAAGYAFAYGDVSTGELKVTDLKSKFALQNELSALATKEIVVPEDLNDEDAAMLKRERLLSVQQDTKPTSEGSYVSQDLTDPAEAAVVQMLMAYLLNTQSAVWHIFKKQSPINRPRIWKWIRMHAAILISYKIVVPDAKVIRCCHYWMRPKPQWAGAY